MGKTYDIIIIGTGTAGRTLAGKIARSGLKTAIIDSREYGGTCPLRGCDPKKVLSTVSDITDWNNRLIGKGAGIKNPSEIDWPSLIKFKRTFTEEYPQSVENYLAEIGVDTYYGRASFENQRNIIVGKDRLIGKYIFLGTGSKPRKLSIPGEEFITTSEGFMEIEKLPEKIIFIGGGYISFEFAHIARRAGSKVTILHRSKKLLGSFDSQMVNLLVKVSEAAGIKILINKPVTAIEKEADGFLVKTEFKSETGTEIQEFRADLVVHGAGRVPDIKDLQLEKAGVEIEKGAIRVNKYMQTSNPYIYAGGDCVSEGMQLTPVAIHQAQVAAANILKADSTEADYSGIPSAVFTTPALASVGINGPDNSELNNANSGRYKVIFHDRSNWRTTRRAGLEYAASKIIIDELEDRLLGAHILGPNAEEVINIFAAIIRLGLKASDIKKLIFSYPTVSSDIVYML